MIKITGIDPETHQQIFGVGLNYEDIDRLKTGKKIAINLLEVSDLNVEIIIFAGETDRAIEHELKDFLIENEG